MRWVTATLLTLFCAGGVALVAAQRSVLDSPDPVAKTSASASEPLPVPAGVGGQDEVSPLSDVDSDAGGVLFDGGVPPSLKEDGPSSVVFGVVLIQYLGAEDAAPGSRSRAEARTLAQQLAELARTDFKAAVKKGDPGSTDNAGRMFRGVLEPAPESVLFGLDKGEVSEPVDTPKGLWIVKRIE